MMSIGELARRVWFFLNRNRVAAELEEEMQLHRELRAEKLAASGSSARDAKSDARKRFGNVTRVEEQTHDARGLRFIEHAVNDTKFALRRLRRRPAFALSTIVVIALGIGATTAVFSAVDAALIRPLPFLRPSELVTLNNVDIPSSTEPPVPGKPTSVLIDQVVAMPDVFSSVAAFASGGLNLSNGSRPRRVTVGVVTTRFFSTLGIKAIHGRTFDETEGKPGADDVAILSDALWRTQFGSSDVVGRQIDLSGNRYTVIAVMPGGFSFPNESELWIPLSVPTTNKTFGAFRYWLPSQVVARLTPGVSREAASSRLLALWETSSTPRANRKHSYIDDEIDSMRIHGAATPLQRSLAGDRKPALLVLMGATVLLLLIACSNTANLLLSDGASRGREVALRAVLGASSGRIVRQLLVESCALALSGAVLGVALSPVALGALRATMPTDLAGLSDARIDMRVLIFATLLAVATGITFGLWPAIAATRGNRAETIKAGGGTNGTGTRMGTARRVLIIAELALTVVLLVGSGLMLRSLARLITQPFGMNPQNVGTLELSFARTDNAIRRRRVASAILNRMSADPAFAASGAINDIPMRDGERTAVLVDIDDRPKGSGFGLWLYASGGYFPAMGIPVLRGRTFTAADDSAGPPTAVINETAAKQWWPGLDPIGRTFRTGGDTLDHYRVVGIVGDVHNYTGESQTGPQFYLSIHRRTPQSIAIVARSSLGSNALLARMQETIRAVDPAQAVYDVRMMESIVAKTVAPQRSNTTLITAFSALALILSAFGVYAVISYSVSRRSREFGIRSALGATTGNIAKLVGEELLWSIVLGLALGLFGAWMLARVLASMLFGIDVHDASIFLLVPLVLTVPAVTAALGPTRRATRINPADVMHAE
jgi:putative ABC transport system permease protein